MSIIKLPSGQKVLIDESNFFDIDDKFRNEDTSSKSITIDKLSVSDRINLNSLSGAFSSIVPGNDSKSVVLDSLKSLAAKDKTFTSKLNSIVLTIRGAVTPNEEQAFMERMYSKYYANTSW